MRRLLALDLASRVGFAFGDGTGEPVFGAKQLRPSGASVASFLSEFDDWLTIFVAKHCVSMVVFEMPILPKLTQLATTRKLHGLAAFCEWRASKLGLAVYEAYQQKTKKFWTGKGNAKKADMTEAARRWGYEVTDDEDDEADALALYWYTVAKAEPALARRFSLGADAR